MPKKTTRRKPEPHPRSTTQFTTEADMGLGVQQLLEIPQMVKATRSSDSTVRRLIASKKLHAFKVGRKWMTRPECIAEYLRRCEEETIAKAARGTSAA